MKYSKMQLHVNVCVHQMSLIFILKIKDYFSSIKQVKLHPIASLYNIYDTEIIFLKLTHLHENTLSTIFVFPYIYIYRSMLPTSKELQIFALRLST